MNWTTSRARFVCALLIFVAGLVALPHTASAQWTKVEQNELVEGMLHVKNGTYLDDTTRVDALTISDSLKVDAGAKLGKDGALVINEDSTNTVDGATTFGSTVALNGATTVGAAQTFGKAGGLVMNADSSNTVDGATTFGSTVALNGATTVGAAQTFGKAGGFVMNADSTNTVDGATTFNAAVTMTQPVSMDSLLKYALSGEFEMTAATDSFAVAGLLTTDRCIWSWSYAPIADFVVTCEAGQVKLVGTSATGSKVHYIIVRPGS